MRGDVCIQTITTMQRFHFLVITIRGFVVEENHSQLLSFFARDIQLALLTGHCSQLEVD